MELLNISNELQVLSWDEVYIRIAAAFFFGLVLGLDRDLKNKPIDVRAYIIVTVATCIIAIAAQEIYFQYQSHDSSGSASLDISRVIQGVLTGIGFLGAGAIIKLDDGSKIVGTATGASIWASGIIGLTLGFGFYGLSFMAFVVIAATLVGGGVLMKKMAGQSDKEDL